MKTIMLIAMLLLVIPSLVFAGDNIVSDKLLIYKDQQMQIINMMLEYVKQNRNLLVDWEKSLRNRRDKTDYKGKMDDNESKLKDLEFKKNDLKLKIIETNGSVPAWWDENEGYYQRMRLYYMK
jgi:hypothetical protein